MEFHTLAAERGWNEPALKATFHQGRNSEILTKLACQDDEATVDLLIDLAICIDNLVVYRRAIHVVIPQATTSQEEPMQIGNTYLYSDERAQQCQEGLCF